MLIFFIQCLVTHQFAHAKFGTGISPIIIYFLKIILELQNPREICRKISSSLITVSIFSFLRLSIFLWKTNSLGQLSIFSLTVFFFFMECHGKLKKKNNCTIMVLLIPLRRYVFLPQNHHEMQQMEKHLKHTGE